MTLPGQCQQQGTRTAGQTVSCHTRANNKLAPKPQSTFRFSHPQSTDSWHAIDCIQTACMAQSCCRSSRCHALKRSTCTEAPQSFLATGHARCMRKPPPPPHIHTHTRAHINTRARAALFAVHKIEIRCSCARAIASEQPEALARGGRLSQLPRRGSRQKAPHALVAAASLQHSKLFRTGHNVNNSRPYSFSEHALPTLTKEHRMQRQVGSGPELATRLLIIPTLFYDFSCPHTHSHITCSHIFCCH